MAFRTVAIRNPAQLKVKSGQLVIVGEQEFSVPPEDIAVLILESREVSISSYCLDLLSQHGVVTIVCGRDHHPSTLVMPYLPHHKQSQIATLQAGMSEPLKKRLWQKIIKQKIMNQALCLDYLRVPGSEQLKKYSSEVLSGDTSGREGTAARYYFPKLFYGHYRNQDNVINDALNYSYSLVRAALAREVVAKGLYPPFGIFHSSQSNQFNLVDDLIEPFRPIVDRFVAEAPPSGEYLSREVRSSYTTVLNSLCLVDGREMTILTASTALVDSFVQAISNKDYSLLMCPVLHKFMRRQTVKD